MNKQKTKREEWEKELGEIIHEHCRGLLETNFGEDVKKMAFLQIDCLARDILPLLSQVRTQAIEETVEEIRKIGKKYFKTHKELMYTPYNQAIDDIISHLNKK